MEQGVGGGKKKHYDVMSAALVNVRLKTQGQAMKMFKD